MVADDIAYYNKNSHLSGWGKDKENNRNIIAQRQINDYSDCYITLPQSSMLASITIGITFTISSSRLTNVQGQQIHLVFPPWYMKGFEPSRQNMLESTWRNSYNCTSNNSGILLIQCKSNATHLTITYWPPYGQQINYTQSSTEFYISNITVRTPVNYRQIYANVIMHTGDPITELLKVPVLIRGQFSPIVLDDSNLSILASLDNEYKKTYITLNLRVPIPAEQGCTIIIQYSDTFNFSEQLNNENTLAFVSGIFQGRSSLYNMRTPSVLINRTSNTFVFNGCHKLSMYDFPSPEAFISGSFALNFNITRNTTGNISISLLDFDRGVIANGNVSLNLSDYNLNHIIMQITPETETSYGRAQQNRHIWYFNFNSTKSTNVHSRFKLTLPSNLQFRDFLSCTSEVTFQESTNSEWQMLKPGQDTACSVLSENGQIVFIVNPLIKFVMPPSHFKLTLYTSAAYLNPNFVGDLGSWSIGIYQIDSNNNYGIVEEGFSNSSFSIIANDIYIKSVKSSSLIVGQTSVTLDFDINSLHGETRQGYYNITFPNEISVIPSSGSISCYAQQMGKNFSISLNCTFYSTSNSIIVNTDASIYLKEDFHILISNMQNPMSTKRTGQFSIQWVVNGTIIARSVNNSKAFVHVTKMAELNTPNLLVQPLNLNSANLITLKFTIFNVVPHLLQPGYNFPVRFPNNMIVDTTQQPSCDSLTNDLVLTCVWINSENNNVLSVTVENSPSLFIPAFNSNYSFELQTAQEPSLDTASVYNFIQQNIMFNERYKVGQLSSYQFSICTNVKGHSISCKQGYTCSEDGNSCLSSQQCPDYLDCIGNTICNFDEGVCEWQCDSNEDCPLTQQCEDKQCKCALNADCNQGQRCINDICSDSECSSNADCLNTDLPYCQDGICIQCMNNNDCRFLPNTPICDITGKCTACIKSLQCADTLIGPSCTQAGQCQCNGVQGQQCTNLYQSQSLICYSNRGGPCGSCLLNDDCTSSVNGVSCANHKCGCFSDLNCDALSSGGSLCNKLTLTCGCSTSQDCYDKTVGSQCSLISHTCGCISSADCLPNAPYCQMSGQCGQRPYTACQDNLDCLPGQMCIDNFCQRAIIPNSFPLILSY